MLRRIRRIPFVNKLFRSFFATIIKPGIFLEKEVLPRWRLSGRIPLQVGQLKFYMFAECDDFLVDTLFYDTIDEKPELILFSDFAKCSKTIFDIGANTGVFSVLASKANGEAEIFAIEPYSVNATRLKKNLEFNAIGNVQVKEIAVGSIDTELLLSVPSDKRICQVSSVNREFSKNFFSKEVIFEEVRVPCRTIDSIVQAGKISLIDLIKIDVETHEIEVFKGGGNTIRDNRPIIFCEVFVDEERELFFNDFLKSYDYYLFLITPVGLVRLDKMEKTYFRNFLFSPISSKQRVLPLHNIDKLIGDFRARS